MQQADLNREGMQIDPRVPGREAIPHATIDLGELLNRVEGDRRLLGQMATLFLMDCPRMLGAVREAVSRNDAKELERAAHALRGSVANFSAHKAVELSHRLEALATCGNLSQAEEIYQFLEREITSLVPVLESFKKG